MAFELELFIFCWEGLPRGLPRTDTSIVVDSTRGEEIDQNNSYSNVWNPGVLLCLIMMNLNILRAACPLYITILALAIGSM